MNDQLLIAYLNDHLAGSVIAIEMGEHCRDQHADADLAGFLDQLLDDIEADRDVLKDVIERLGGKQDTAKKSAAWLTEKAGRIKLSGTSPAEIAFNRMEQLEVLMLGIRGKQSLWEVLADLAPHDERLTGFDWNRLSASATEQADHVNQHRRQAAREALRDAEP